MKTEEIIDALNAEIDRLTNVRDLLQHGKGASSSASKASKVSITSAPGQRKRRGMSAEGKARIAAAQRERWAKQKGKAAKSTGTSAKSTKSAKPSAAKSNRQAKPAKRATPAKRPSKSSSAVAPAATE